MYRVTILYPTAEGATFDHDYYRDSHMPLLASRLGDTCQSWSSDKVLDGPFAAIGQVVIDDLAAFQAKMGEHAGEIMGDVANYTSISPQLVVSEITH